MSASDTVTVVIAGLGIVGTLASTIIAQRGEANRIQRAQTVEEARRAQDRQDALQRERREAIRADYREIMRFVARTRLFVSEVRARLEDLERATEHYSSDAREVEDLEARAQMLRNRFLTDLPDVQGLVGAWGSDQLIGLFDEIDDFGPIIAASVSIAIHLRVDGNRMPEAVETALADIDRLLDLLNTVRGLLRSEQEPT